MVEGGEIAVLFHVPHHSWLSLSIFFCPWVTENTSLFQPYQANIISLKYLMVWFHGPLFFLHIPLHYGLLSCRVLCQVVPGMDPVLVIEWFSSSINLIIDDFPQIVVSLLNPLSDIPSITHITWRSWQMVFWTQYILREPHYSSQSTIP